MKEFVQGKQADLAKAIEDLKASIDTYGQALSAAIAEGKIDAAKQDQAKEDYAKANWYYQVLITGPYESAGSQIAMLDTTTILKNANVAIEDGTGLLA